MTSRVGVALGAALAIGLAVVGVAVLIPSEPPNTNPVAMLDPPAPGEARADYLPDGTPVWAMGHDNGSVTVLSGFDTHVPFGMNKLLWWCPAADALENPHHGSKWDEFGVKLGGPAPANLPSFEVNAAGGDLVVGELRAGPPLGTRPLGPGEQDREWCTDPAATTFHTFEGWRVWDSPTEAVGSADAARGRWLLVEGRLVVRADNAAVVFCSLAGCHDAVIAAGLEVPPPELREFHPWTDTVVLARSRDGELVDLTRIVDPAP